MRCQSCTTTVIMVLALCVSGVFTFYHLSCHRCLRGSLCGSSRSFRRWHCGASRPSEFVATFRQPQSQPQPGPSFHARLLYDIRLQSLVSHSTSPVVAKIFNGFSFVVSVLLCARLYVLVFVTKLQLGMFCWYFVQVHRRPVFSWCLQSYYLLWRYVKWICPLPPSVPPVFYNPAPQPE